MNMGKVENIQKLSSANYEIWKVQIKSVLRFNDLWNYVNGTTVKPEEDDAAWISKDEKALDLIILSLQPDQFNHIKGTNTSAAAWEALKEVYESKSPLRQSVLFKQLYRLRKTSNQSMTQFINEFIRIAEQLNECDMKLPENLLAIWLLNSLPSEYENFCVALESRERMPTLEELKTRLLEEEVRRTENEKDRDYNPGEALYANKKVAYKKEQPKSVNAHTHQGKRRDYKCYTCGKVGHVSKYCKSRPKKENDEQNRGAAMHATALKANVQRSDVWCLDSGATAHMCKDENRFATLNRMETTKIYTAAEDNVESVGIGEVCIKIQNSPNDTNNIRLQNTMLIPQFRNNLLSVSNITDNGYKIVFHKDYANVVKEDGKDDGPVAMKAKRQDKLYLVQETSSREFAQLSKVHDSDLMKWHCRLGHLNFNDVKKMTNMVTGMTGNFNGPNVTCEICCKGKIHRLPHKPTTTREKDTLGLIHSDICGPMQVPSLGGARYFVTFIDDKTRHIEVAMLKERCEVLKAFKEYKAKAEKSTGYSIKKIRSDNAKEYLSKEFTNFLKEEGISRQLSVEYTPQQNGVAERANRTLVEMARCMLLHAQLPYSLWAEAVNAAAYVRNRCPTKALNKVTPHEKWTGNKPHVSHMRTFGSRVIALKKTHRHNKFAPKAKEYLLVGYSAEAKAYRLWERGTCTVIKHRDIRFLENDTIPSQGTEEILCELPLEVERLEKQQEITEEEDDTATQPEENAQSGADTENVGESLLENEIDDTPTTSAQGRPRPGRPRLLKTGKPGRPRKLFNYANTASSQYTAPKNVKEAMNSPEKDF